MANKNMETQITVEFDEATSRQQLNSGENINILFGKIKKIFSDLKAICFSGSYNDLSDTPDVVTKEYVDSIKSQCALNRTTLGTQRKNLLKNTGTSKTMYGVSFTVNDDMSVTANGTNNAQNNSNFFVFSDTLQPGRYILTGCPNGGGTVYQMRVGKGTGDGEYVGHDKGSGLSFTVSEAGNYTVMCQILPGQTADNVTFYPMLRDADITDDTYEEYVEDVNTRLNNLLARIEALESSSG